MHPQRHFSVPRRAEGVPRTGRPGGPFPGAFDLAARSVRSTPDFNVPSIVLSARVRAGYTKAGVRRGGGRGLPWIGC
jgi:hypothetical protein